MACNNYTELKAHYGHKIVVACYGKGDNYAVECEDCNTVLMDFNRPKAPRTTRRKHR